jgi:hypothetical protein
MLIIANSAAGSNRGAKIIPLKEYHISIHHKALKIIIPK